MKTNFLSNLFGAAFCIISSTGNAQNISDAIMRETGLYAAEIMKNNTLEVRRNGEAASYQSTIRTGNDLILLFLRETVPLHLTLDKALGNAPAQCTVFSVVAGKCVRESSNAPFGNVTYIGFDATVCSPLADDAHIQEKVTVMFGPKVPDINASLSSIYTNTIEP